MAAESEKPIESPVFTLKEAAKFLNCSVWTVRSLIWNGDISYQKLGNHFVVSRKELEQFLESGWRRNGDPRIAVRRRPLRSR